LAEAELEYRDDHRSPSVYVKFLVNETKEKIQLLSKLGISPERKIYLLAWTTTPWTLPANQVSKI